VSDDLSGDERAELERLRAQAAASGGARVARAGRWVVAGVLLVVAAMLSVLAVTAVYLRSEVLDTDTYVQTVAPLARNAAVREAVANRLTDEIVTRTDVAGLAKQLADRLVADGAPTQLRDLVDPAVNGLRSFLYNEVYKLLGTAQFQQLWDEVNRRAHAAVVTVLTGGQGQLVSSSGTTVTIDLGALLSAAKDRLVERGLTFVSQVPDVSIQYELVDSKQLPKVRTYARALDTAGTWLPFVALAVLIIGVLVAPDRRRGLVTAVVLVAVLTAVELGAIALGRTYYVDNLPSGIRSPQAAAAVIDTVLRYLVAALRALLAAALVVLVGALLAGPSRPATDLRRLVNRGLDASARALARAGSWVATIGRPLAGARGPIRVGVVLAAALGLILANRPGVAAVLWTTFAVLVAFAVVEVFARGARVATG
jgi:hypothetical protein